MEGWKRREAATLLTVSGPFTSGLRQVPSLVFLSALAAAAAASSFLNEYLTGAPEMVAAAGAAEGSSRLA